MSQTLGETRPCANFQTNSVFANIEDREKGQYSVTIKDSKYSFLLVNEMDTQGQQPSIKEGYVFQDIKDGEVEEGSSQQIEGAELEQKEDLMQLSVVEMKRGLRILNMKTIVFLQNTREFFLMP